MKHGIKLDCEVGTVHEFAELDHFAEGHFVAGVEAWHFNELIVRLVGEVEDFAVDIDAVDKTAKIQEVQNSERGFDFAKVKNNSGS